jgi:hypothetical protein
VPPGVAVGRVQALLEAASSREREAEWVLSHRQERGERPPPIGDVGFVGPRGPDVGKPDQEERGGTRVFQGQNTVQLSGEGPSQALQTPQHVD